jgi:hypothetical protein
MVVSGVGAGRWAVLIVVAIGLLFVVVQLAGHVIQSRLVQELLPIGGRSEGGQMEAAT